MSEKDRATFADDYANEFARRVGEAADPKAVLEAIKGSAAMTEIRVALGRKRADKMVNRMKAQAARPAQKDPQSRQETRP